MTRIIFNWERGEGEGREGEKREEEKEGKKVMKNVKEKI